MAVDLFYFWVNLLLIGTVPANKELLVGKALMPNEQNQSKPFFGQYPVKLRLPRQNLASNVKLLFKQRETYYRIYRI